MNKKSLIEKVLILETEKADIQSQLDKIVSEAVKGGEMLKSQPFIPEYIGFTESIITDKETGATNARVYTKAGYNIFRPVGSENKKWAVMDQLGNTSSVFIHSMYHALIVLNALGMDITINDYHEDNKRLEKALLDNVQESLENK